MKQIVHASLRADIIPIRIWRVLIPIWDSLICFTGDAWIQRYLRLPCYANTYIIQGLNQIDVDDVNFFTFSIFRVHFSGKAKTANKENINANAVILLSLSVSRNQLNFLFWKFSLEPCEIRTNRLLLRPWNHICFRTSCRSILLWELVAWPIFLHKELKVWLRASGSKSNIFYGEMHPVLCCLFSATGNPWLHC